MPDTIQGVRAAAGTQGITSARIISDMGDVLLLQPDKAPLAVLTMKLAKESAVSHKIEWQEDDLQTVWGVLQTGTSVTDETTFTPVTITNYIVGDMIKVPRSGDVMRVSTISGSNIVVSRVSGNNTVAASEPVLIMNQAYGHGADKPTLRSMKVTTVTNFCQSFMKAYGVAKELNLSKLQGGPDLPRERKKKAIEMARDLEYSALFGLRGSDETGTAGIYYAGGFFQYVSTNAVSVGGALTETKMADLLSTITRYGSKNKLLLCGSKVINGIDRIAKADLHLVPSDETFGVSIKEWENTGYGRILIHNHWLLEGATYAGYAVAVDLENFKMVVLQDVQLEKDIQTPGGQRKEEQLTAVLGWKVALEKSMGYLTGCTG